MKKTQQNKKAVLTGDYSKNSFVKIGKSTVLIKPGIVEIRSSLINHQ